MKRLFTIVLIGIIGHNYSIAQCVENPTNRIILAGDSWAAFMNGDQTINDGLKLIGHSDKRFVSNPVISENGADTQDFVQEDKQNAIQALVNANPTVDIIHMSIGGNDVLGDWNVDFTQAETDNLESEVANRLDTIVDFLKTTREGMHVFWPGYCYPNFEEVIMDIAPFEEQHPFFSTWDDMGQPTFEQLNNILVNFSDSVNGFALNDPQMDFVPAQGVLQYHYGQQEALGVAPGGTYMPFEAPLPYGYADYPSPSESMRLYAGIFTDCFHLSKNAYLVFFKYQAEKFYQKKLMDELYQLSAGGAVDGTVSSSGSVEQTLSVGESGGSELATVLTFDVSDLADTTLEGASIFLRREELVGNDPFDEDILVKMANGSFGSSADVEGGDFMDMGQVSGNVCVFGSREEDGHWLRLDLTAEMLEAFGENDQVQFQISAPGFVGGAMKFHDASNPEYAPVLNLNYVETGNPTSVTEPRASVELPVYPIPTTGELTIGVDPSEIESVEVLNILGKTVMTPRTQSNRIDIAELPFGSYILRITTKAGISTKRIIKR